MLHRMIFCMARNSRHIRFSMLNLQFKGGLLSSTSWLNKMFS